MAIDRDTLENQPGESLRDALDDAFQQHSADDSGADAPAVPVAKAPAENEDPASAAAQEQRARDQGGRFAKAQKVPTEGLDDPTKPGAAVAGALAPVAPAPQPTEAKPPASWTPAARELWSQVPQGVQQEIHRREHEAQQVLQNGARSRQFVEAFENIVRPFEVFIRTENSNPLQAVQNLMSTAAEFRVGTPQRKVDLVAGIISNFGIDVNALDAALARQIHGGGQQQQPQQQPQQFRDPRVDQMLLMQQQQAAQAQQQHFGAVQNELQAFGAKHEFYGDVAAYMADILEMRAKRGEVMDLEAAYKQACALHPDVSTILTQRQAQAKPAAGLSQAALRQKRAAASVKGDGGPDGARHVPKDDSLRGALEAAFDQVDNS